MKVRELIRMIETDGWYLVRTRGDHRQFHHPTKPGTVTVAGTPGVDIPPGTLNSILKQAGLRSKAMRYLVIIERGESSWGAHVPDLPGCIAVAETRKEVRALIKEAIDFHLEGLRAHGEPIPIPSSESEFIETDAA